MKEEVNSNGEMDGTFLEGLRTNPFLVKPNYFDNLHDQILSNVKLDDIKKEGVFKTPENYFQTLEEQVLSQVVLPENGSSIFKVPDQYFESLENKILASVEEPTQKNNIRSIFSRNLIRYAAAILIMISTGLALYFSQQKTNIDTEIAKIPDQEIIDYLNMYSDSNDIQLILENTNTDDLSSLENHINHL
ncbi:hypothetical protein Pedsa_0174 [Pseudopedobacter saltans DSM 12145]|uniref:Uncharacterized protein n=1 Tax=Pseudopedobacter saltans (strain ATCC 51119 / DSM 12145 / JCM 21818 / CCUG 39354 / LMG 10337 / NBRC 100064 / NCIMB 13643) TaxID=762903 RepID=F0SDN3_PSESL|nr:hypothetical protein [Pseudopedobacter saltans]ADY50760.1 hypothetical protein Pedsa_0174 [Pseudopedobacter saltans DSM 12145]